MAVSEVDICNEALALAGQGPIAGLSDGSRLSRLCALHYPRQRDALIREYRWRFAQFRLAGLAADPVAPAFGYTNRYPLPEDCLRVLSVNELDPELDSDLDPSLWVVEGQFVLTDDASPISLHYLRQVLDPSEFDVSFVEGLVIRIARKIAPSVVESSPNLADFLRAEGEEVIRRARFLSAIEGRQRRRRHTRSGHAFGGHGNY